MHTEKSKRDVAPNPANKYRSVLIAVLLLLFIAIAAFFGGTKPAAKEFIPMVNEVGVMAIVKDNTLTTFNTTQGKVTTTMNEWESSIWGKVKVFNSTTQVLLKFQSNVMPITVSYATRVQKQWKEVANSITLDVSESLELADESVQLGVIHYDGIKIIHPDFAYMYPLECTPVARFAEADLGEFQDTLIMQQTDSSHLERRLRDMDSAQQYALSAGESKIIVSFNYLADKISFEAVTTTALKFYRLEGNGAARECSLVLGVEDRLTLLISKTGYYQIVEVE